MSSEMRAQILSAAQAVVQAQGYGAMSFRDLAAAVGIKSASVHYHFPTKGDLGAALAGLYTERARADLDAVLAETSERGERLQRYANLFRKALTDGNRLCLISMLSAEIGDLPDAVRAEVEAFADLNVSWLAHVLAPNAPDMAADQARAIYAAVAGAQLVARTRADVATFDIIIESYRKAGLIPC